MKKNIVKCPYCGAQATIRPSSVVHKEKAIPNISLYVCSRYPSCDSYVGVHKHNNKPMGTLANGQLRHKRIMAHKAFNTLWGTGKMKKWQAYKWMQAKFNLSEEQAHIGLFSKYMCDELIKECEKVAVNMKIVA